MTQTSFPFPFSLSKTSGRYTTSILLSPLGEKSLNFHLLKWQRRAGPPYFMPISLMDWYLPNRNCSDGQLLGIFKCLLRGGTYTALTAAEMSIRWEGW